MDAKVNTVEEVSAVCRQRRKVDYPEAYDTNEETSQGVEEAEDLSPALL